MPTRSRGNKGSRNTRGIGSRWIGNSGPRIGARWIGRSNLGWGNRGPKSSGSRRGHSGPLVIVPGTTEQTIIFPYSSVHCKFNVHGYNPALTDNKVSLEEATSFLSQIDNLVAPARGNWGKGLLQLVGVLAFIACLAVLISVPVTFIMVDNLAFPTPIIITAIIFGGFLVLYLLTWCFVQGKRGQIINECRKSVQAFIDQNTDSYRARNLTWVIPVHFPWWIELWKGDGFQAATAGNLNNGNHAIMQKQASPMTIETAQQQQHVEINMYAQNYFQNQTMGTQASYRNQYQHEDNLRIYPQNL